jgi:hypothetical protein
MNALARKYNIATATIHSIIHNKTWIHPWLHTLMVYGKE